MSGVFITFEGNEGSGKSTQIERLAVRLRTAGRQVVTLREPGGTPIGEEIRHTLKHSHQNQTMTPEAELLLMNASRAQLVREVIRPALAAGSLVLCDRFYDSTTAYQGYGRQMDLARVQAVIEFAVGSTHPRLTLLMLVPHELSEQRRLNRQARQPSLRDRFEEADREFFERVDEGYRALARQEPDRVKVIRADRSADEVELEIWHALKPVLGSSATAKHS
jgi:dTMP kinase